MRLGNKRGSSRGSYIKLTGDELFTKHTTARSCAQAREFAAWFSANYETVLADIAEKLILDDDVLHETYIAVYDGIALKGFDVEDFGAYFYRAYFTNRINGRIAGDKTEQANVRVDDPDVRFVIEDIAESDFDVEGFERAIDDFNNEVNEYVADFYDPESVSLFEMYVGLYPETSYKKLAAELDIPFSRVWTTLGVIKRDIVETFGDKKDQILKHYL